MHHDPFAQHPTDQETEGFWTDIPEGDDMLPAALPGMMPGFLPGAPQDAAGARQDAYGTGIDPHAPQTPADDDARPGDLPGQPPQIRAEAAEGPGQEG